MKRRRTFTRKRDFWFNIFIGFALVFCGVAIAINEGWMEVGR